MEVFRSFSSSIILMILCGIFSPSLQAESQVSYEKELQGRWEYLSRLTEKKVKVLAVEHEGRVRGYFASELSEKEAKDLNDFERMVVSAVAHENLERVLSEKKRQDESWPDFLKRVEIVYANPKNFEPIEITFNEDLNRLRHTPDVRYSSMENMWKIQLVQVPSKEDQTVSVNPMAAYFGDFFCGVMERITTDFKVQGAKEFFIERIKEVVLGMAIGFTGIAAIPTVKWVLLAIGGYSLKDDIWGFFTNITDPQEAGYHMGGLMVSFFTTILGAGMGSKLNALTLTLKKFPKLKFLAIAVEKMNNVIKLLAEKDKKAWTKLGGSNKGGGDAGSGDNTSPSGKKKTMGTDNPSKKPSVEGVKIRKLEEVPSRTKAPTRKGKVNPTNPQMKTSANPDSDVEVLKLPSAPETFMNTGNSGGGQSKVSTGPPAASAAGNPGNQGLPVVAPLPVTTHNQDAYRAFSQWAQDLQYTSPEQQRKFQELNRQVQQLLYNAPHKINENNVNPEAVAHLVDVAKKNFKNLPQITKVIPGYVAATAKAIPDEEKKSVWLTKMNTILSNGPNPAWAIATQVEIEKPDLSKQPSKEYFVQDDDKPKDDLTLINELLSGKMTLLHISALLRIGHRCQRGDDKALYCEKVLQMWRAYTSMAGKVKTAPESSIKEDEKEGISEEEATQFLEDAVTYVTTLPEAKEEFLEGVLSEIDQELRSQGKKIDDHLVGIVLMIYATHITGNTQSSNGGVSFAKLRALIHFKQYLESLGLSPLSAGQHVKTLSKKDVEILGKSKEDDVIDLEIDSKILKWCLSRNRIDSHNKYLKAYRADDFAAMAKILRKELELVAANKRPDNFVQHLNMLDFIVNGLFLDIDIRFSPFRDFKKETLDEIKTKLGKPETLRIIFYIHRLMDDMKMDLKKRYEAISAALDVANEPDLQNVLESETERFFSDNKKVDVTIEAINIYHETSTHFSKFLLLTETSHPSYIDVMSVAKYSAIANNKIDQLKSVLRHLYDGNVELARSTLSDLIKLEMSSISVMKKKAESALDFIKMIELEAHADKILAEQIVSLESYLTEYPEALLVYERAFGNIYGITSKSIIEILATPFIQDPKTNAYYLDHKIMTSFLTKLNEAIFTGNADVVRAFILNEIKRRFTSTDKKAYKNELKYLESLNVTNNQESLPQTENSPDNVSTKANVDPRLAGLNEHYPISFSQAVAGLSSGLVSHALALLADSDENILGFVQAVKDKNIRLAQLYLGKALSETIKDYPPTDNRVTSAKAIKEKLIKYKERAQATKENNSTNTSSSVEIEPWSVIEENPNSMTKVLATTPREVPALYAEFKRVVGEKGVKALYDQLAKYEPRKWINNTSALGGQSSLNYLPEGTFRAHIGKHWRVFYTVDYGSKEVRIYLLSNYKN